VLGAAAAAAAEAAPAAQEASSQANGLAASRGAPVARPKKKATLIKAVKDGNVALVDELLRDGCNLEELGMWDNTPLLAACSYGRAEAALKLIQRKANISAKNEHGATPMHYAAVEGSLAVVEALIAHAQAEGGAELVKKIVDAGDAKVYNRHLDAYGQRTPLGCAAESGFDDVVGVLLAAGASVEAPSDGSRTPLWLACRHGRARVASVLLHHGAATSAKDEQGVSVLGAAAASGDEPLILQLLAHGVADVNDTVGLPLRDVVRAGKRAAVEALLTHGAHVQLPATAADGAEAAAADTPLHAACAKGDEYLVSLLVRSKADPSRTDATGLTAFDLLRRRGMPDKHIVALLRSPGPSAQDGSTGDDPQLEEGAPTPPTSD